MTTTATQFSSLLSACRAFILITAMLALAACGESATAPQTSIDRVAAGRVVPAVTDARIRITQGIENAVVRERVLHDVTELESALLDGDGDKARFHLRVLGTVTSEYKAQQGTAATDGAEISAIELMMIAVTKAINGTP